MDLRGLLQDCPLVAILRGVRPDEVDAVGDVLVEAGLRIIEVPLNSPEPLDSIARLQRRHGRHALIGAGTVRRTADVDDEHYGQMDSAVNAGGRAVAVDDNVDRGVLDEAVRAHNGRYV